MSTYDYIIAGAGCAGLSMAWRILNSPSLSTKKVLLVDRERKRSNDRTWCFWHEGASEWDEITSFEWSKVAFHSNKGSEIAELKRHTYRQISSIDYYNLIYNKINASSQFEIKIGEIQHLSVSDNVASLQVDGERFFATYIFDSRYLANDRSLFQDGHSFLLQHFKGWVIETFAEAFDTEQVTLMDFRVEQEGYAGFLYVLPYAPNKALVEYTLFSPNLCAEAHYAKVIQDYIHNYLNVNSYAILEEESGIIPMTDAEIPASPSRQVIQIGTRGGAVKPTTGYAFLTIQEQTQKLVKQLEDKNHPKLESSKKGRFHFYDRLLLHILSREGKEARPIFSKLFLNNPVETIFTFLDEKSHIGQEALIFSTLPIKPFLRAIVKIYLAPHLDWVRRGISLGKTSRIGISKGRKGQVREALPK